MTTDVYLIRQCTNTKCNFRFPAPKHSGIGIQCPKCKSETKILQEIKLGMENHYPEEKLQSTINLEVVLDNIRSTFNVGAIFRSADGVGVRKIHLCGITPPPTNPKVHKTSLGSEDTVQYETHPNTLTLVKMKKKSGFRIWALEKTSKSESIFKYDISNTSQPTVLILGNEIIGIDPDVLNECDNHLHIPMVGLQNSLNVAIAYGIAVYSLTKNFYSNLGL